MSVGHCMLPPTLLLITSFLLPLSTAYCPEKYSYKTCYQLHQAFEHALLASSENRYKLREEYLPSSKSSPVYGHVGYNIIYHNNNIESNYNRHNTTPACDEDNVKFPQVPVEPSRCIPWSNTAVLAYIDPMFLNSFQLHLLDLLLQEAGAVAVNLSECGNKYHPPSSMHVHLNLTLELHEQLPCVPSEDQMRTVLADLTSWLKAHAVSQNNTPVTVYSLYKGYSNIEETEYLQNILCAIYVLSALVMAVAMGYSAPACYKWIVEKTDSEQNQWYSFFWAASLVATLCNGFILGFEIWFFFDTVSSHQFNILKLAFVVFFCLLDLIIAKRITECHEEKNMPQQPNNQSTHTLQETLNMKPFQLHVPRVAVILSRCFCCTFFCSKHNQQAHVRSLALWSLIFFVHLLSLATLPTVIWVIVLPLRVTSLLTSTWATFFCLTAFVAVFISIPQQLKNKNMSAYKVVLLLTVPALSSAIVILGTILYLQLVMNSIDTTSVAGVIASFLPSAGLTMIGWVVSRVGGVEGEGRDPIQYMEEGRTMPHYPSHNGREWLKSIVHHLPWRSIHRST